MPAEFKESPNDLVTRKPLERITRLRWWYIILLILGLIAAVVALVTQFNITLSSGHPSGERVATLALLTLQSDAPQDENSRKTGLEEFRPQVVLGIFLLIGTLTLISLLGVLFAQDPKKLEIASDILKTCIGFFIGVATGYF
jgi:uncharacterized membrane protein YhaH (DUF805 family)